MKSDELSSLVTVCLSAAREAGKLVREGFRTPVLVEHKGVVDLVTAFDRRSEALLRERLTAATSFAIIGEETGVSGVPGEHVFYIDPIDGTTNFVHGHPFWCVSIGLVQKGQPVLGVVVAPMLELEWYGYTTEDGTRHAVRTYAGNDGPCIVSPLARFEDSLLATGFPYDRRTDPDNNFDAFVAIKQRCQAVRRCGSAALDLCLVADGTYEGYWERKLNPWDIAGGTALIRAAGGTVTDYDGSDSFIATGHCVATNSVIHNALLSALAQVESTKATPDP